MQLKQELSFQTNIHHSGNSTQVTFLKEILYTRASLDR